MHLCKDDIPVKIEIPGAIARQLPDFGTASGPMGAEYFSLAAGADMAPLLEGLVDDTCDSPHWGYMLTGDLFISYTDGTSERATTGEVFYWGPGHSVRADADSELILFSPQHEHGAVMDHILGKLANA